MEENIIKIYSFGYGIGTAVRRLLEEDDETCSFHVQECKTSDIEKKQMYNKINTKSKQTPHDLCEFILDSACVVL